MDYFAELDRLIEGPVYVIDYLPGPVPASRGRHYWKNAPAAGKTTSIS